LKFNFFLQGSVDSVAMTNLSGPNLSGENSSRGYMYGWMWWKPQDDFVCQPPPPSYDDAVANDRLQSFFVFLISSINKKYLFFTTFDS